MFVARGSIWGPPPLPELLRDQLAAHGFTGDDAGRCARLINERRSGAATTSLFVDLGSCKFLEGDIDGAIAAWRHVVTSAHDAAAARGLLNLGLLYEHLHLGERALALFDAVAARDVDPHVVPAAMASARCRVALDQPDRAMETMARLAQRTMARRPDGAELIATLYGLGEVAEQAGRLDRAERAWRVAAVGPQSQIQRAARDRLVALLTRSGRFGEALEVVDEPQVVASMAPEVVLGLIDGLLAVGELESARALVVNIREDGIEPDVAFRLVDARRRAGMVNEAIDVLEVLLARGDDATPRAACLLGEIYESFDMTAPARSVLQRAIATEHPYWTPKAKRLLARLADDAAITPAETSTEAKVPASAAQPVEASTEAPAGRGGMNTNGSHPVTDEREPADTAPGDAHESESTDRKDAVVDLRDPVIVALEADRVHDSERNGASAFADHIEDSPRDQNPYAALAPEEFAADPRPGNPYAELAPGFDDDFLPSDDVEPGDWESMLGDWKPPPEKKRSSAFSRYT